ncbi:MAG TPA: Cof-type HAD-IIB family hydrolase [Caproiciproducens sp.]|jgi:Predicted hydrolases of the HAD superfamily|nr:Cof-type HAD-IIB family hydrolase [Caproiciproducens sp.]
MNIQLIAIDMDGTTLKNDHFSISQRTRRAIESAIAKGIAVVPATGRNDALLPASVMEIPGIRYVIASNGAVVHDRKEQKNIHSNFIPAPLALRILEVLPEKDLLIEIFQNGRLYVERSFLETLEGYPIEFLSLDFMKSISTPVDDLAAFFREHGDGIEKINLPYIPSQWQHPLSEKLSAVKSSVTVTSSVSHNMEINGKGATKGAALSWLCGFLNIPRENVLAVGDNGNDIDMLEYAGISAAMANGTEEAKAAANTVTLSCEEDGVALAIEKYALNSGIAE